MGLGFTVWGLGPISKTVHAEVLEPADSFNHIRDPTII